MRLKKASSIACWPMCDCMSKAERKSQLHRAWLGIVRGKLNVAVPQCGRMNSKEPLSRYAQIGSEIEVERQQR